LIYEDLPKVVYSLEVYALRNISNRNILLPKKTVHLLFDFHIWGSSLCLDICCCWWKPV